MPGPQPQSPPPNLSAAIPKLIPRKRAPAARDPPSAPPPPTPALPPPPTLDHHTYTVPTRRILSPDDHALFLQSPTYTLVTAFIFNIADSVRDRPTTSVTAEDCTPAVRSILDILQQAGAILDDTPPGDTGSRFGNPVFRIYIEKLTAQLPAWHAQLGLHDAAQVAETSTYLAHAFGSPQRIDYGSGHELNFFLWLLCLNRLSLLPDTTFPSLALVVLPAYLRLMRRLQAAYYLEPAGSHGVWGLDDYQFLPFLFGAAQLAHHAYITPRAIHSALVLEDEAPRFLYLEQVAYVNSVKSVEGLRWHSPMLDDISAARGWGKVEAGMRKMFVKEVLGKLPVMQHFLFGSLVPACEGMSSREEAEAAEKEDEVGGEVKVFDDAEGKRHVHASAGWGDCCGIRVPAAVGAEGEERKTGGARRLRRVPFD